MKIYPFATLSWVNKDENTLLVQQIFLAHRAIYYPQLLKTSLLSETIVPQAQPAFFCLNSAIITVE